ncbi:MULTISPECIES: L-type lectin-domain containing protein [Chryseobacterium]|uniref:Uncharacterized protein n=1 Tax=Chryseobacterium camelliae TaxID=1265445 RepID=A0ABU0TLM2_9FLAO|nr:MULTISPECIES: L-type lectin-domain containing protein [Chryseobacterium]MDT3408449.1 hypothetical protein [Pseudacidovorax intermedius]MDQ1097696.1 hypothetical protein [Chryseobacterium camelliae]MDQ1101627.1 hypothetical protein [Chryseobacterium sp. SORGH_AS_1048]MDR6085068.1 hypothetical protein [Chryseobacterium sp. SORGH_AS_0909]MDR6129423.1 hypothetical protein [Chryseobacterium sp. SORGH_AS_1175]
MKNTAILLMVLMGHIAFAQSTPCTAKAEGAPIYKNDFGTGNATTTDANVVGHSYQAITPPDGSYTVTRSLAQTEMYTRTDLTGDKDAGYNTITAGSTDGRYLMINIDSPGTVNQAIYRIGSVSVVPGQEYRFRLDMAGLCNSCSDVPNLQLSIKDTNNNTLASANSGNLGMVNDDVWRRLMLSFTPTTSTVKLEIVNLQANGNNGNDVGIDNIVFTPIECDSDGDGIANSLDLDDDNDGIDDCTEKGFDANSSVSTIFKLNGNATQVNSKQVRLTEALTNEAGQMWSYGKVDFTKSFTLSYEANFGSSDAGADGIATVFHNSPAGVNAVGASGGGLGALGIQNGIVLEVDTYDNGTGVGDIPNDHGQIWASASQSGANLLTTAVDLGNVEDNTWRSVVITWDFPTKKLSYTVGGVLAGAYTFPSSNPITSYFGGASKVYFGYTASTGSAVNEQSVRYTDFCSQLPLELDTDGDGIPNHLDTDSDGDSCPDALEGAENVSYTMIYPMTSSTYPGQIRVRYDGVTVGTPDQIISTASAANGIPQVVNNAANNTNSGIGLSNVQGAADVGFNTIGQGVGTSQNASQKDLDCRCFRPATSPGTGGLSTSYGITALQRGGANSGGWPMKITGALMVLDAKTNGFVINRLTTTQISQLTAVKGMMVYDTTANCLKIYDGTVWACYTQQTCDQF